MIEWTDALSIDVARIDDQHRTFIGLVNRLNTFSRGRASREELKVILADLVCYAEGCWCIEVRADAPMLDMPVDQAVRTEFGRT